MKRSLLLVFTVAALLLSPSVFAQNAGGQHAESPREFQEGEHTGAPAGLAARVGDAVR